jgi:hypothetical protein
MIKFEKTFTINPNLVINIKRIGINKNSFKNNKLIPIKNSAYFFVAKWLDREPHVLPKLYTAFTHLTGPSDSQYDDYSYSFMFELHVRKNDMNNKYVYHVYHYRSYIEFSVYQIVPKIDLRDVNIMHQPNDQLFSNDDICYFSDYFCGYVLGYMEGVAHTPSPFVKCSDSNLLLFGYFDNEYFIKQYDDYDQYAAEKLQFQNGCQ